MSDITREILITPGGVEARGLTRRQFYLLKSHLPNGQPVYRLDEEEIEGDKLVHVFIGGLPIKVASAPDRYIIVTPTMVIIGGLEEEELPTEEGGPLKLDLDTEFSVDFVLIDMTEIAGIESADTGDN